MRTVSIVYTIIVEFYEEGGGGGGGRWCSKGVLIRIGVILLFLDLSTTTGVANNEEEGVTVC